WTDENILGSLGGHSTFNWFTYEDAGQDFYQALWKGETRSMLRTYCFDKPSEILRVLLSAMHPSQPFRTDAPAARFNPASPLVLVLAAPAIILIASSPAPGAMLLVALTVGGFSLMPAFMFYPVVHTMIGFFSAISLVAYVSLGCGVRVLGLRFGA